MKKILLLLLPALIFAQSFMISNIPLPKTYIQNLDPYECNEKCLQKYLDHGMIFSFLAHANKKLKNEQQNEVKLISVSIFNLGSFHNPKKLKMAILLPYKKIGKYASSITNAAFAYLITQNHPFMLKSYKVNNENLLNLKRALDLIQKDGFKYIIAPLTKEGVDNIVRINPKINIYFPTVNKKDINTSSRFLSFGAIDYTAQSDLLIKEATMPLVIFSDKSLTGKKLAIYQKKAFLTRVTKEQVNEENIYKKEKKKKVINFFISKRTTNLESYLKKNQKILEGSFMLNTPIIKSGMIMSQLTLYDTNATNVLSTQINYDPLLLSMTQYIDRKHMIVANSITKNNNVLIETNSLLENDIVYDWINYATIVGVDYFYSLATNEDRIYTIEMKNQQMLYDTELLRPTRSKFIKYISKKQTLNLME